MKTKVGNIVHSVMKYKHGKLIAYFNSSIRFWDLRYLKTKRELNSLKV